MVDFVSRSCNEDSVSWYFLRNWLPLTYWLTSNMAAHHWPLWVLQPKIPCGSEGIFPIYHHTKIKCQQNGEQVCVSWNAPSILLVLLFPSASFNRHTAPSCDNSLVSLFRMTWWKPQGFRQSFYNWKSNNLLTICTLSPVRPFKITFSSTFDMCLLRQRGAFIVGAPALGQSLYSII